MTDTISGKRLVLRAVLHQVSPMVIRLISISDQLQLAALHDIFRAILGWQGDLGYIIRIQGQEFNSFRRKTRSKALHEFKLHRQEKFLYICDTLHMWEWEVRVVDIQEAGECDERPMCVGGRGAAPSPVVHSEMFDGVHLHRLDELLFHPSKDRVIARLYG